MNKTVIGFLFLLTSVSLVSAKDDFFDLWDLEGEFYLESDWETAPTDYFRLGLELESRFEVSDSWEIGLEVDFKTDEVETEEVWVRYRSPGRLRVQLGMFENEILLEDQFSEWSNPFETDGLIRSRMNKMGWYSPGATGLKVYRNYKEGTLPYTAFGHVFFQPSGREVQINTGLFYPYRGEDSWLGVTAAYYPFFLHRDWVGTASSHTQDHNFLFQAVLADIRGGGNIIYKGDITLGSNLIDPVGYLHFPGEGQPSWFLGSDLMVGYPMAFPSENSKKKDAFLWTPGFNTAFLILDLNQMESWTASLRTGQLLAWDNTFFLHLELGTNLVTNYESSNGGGSLQTGLEILWGVSFEIKF